MLKILILFIIFIIEVLLLLVVALFLLLGLVGVFLPVIPGVALAGAGIAIYSLMIKNNFGTITPTTNRFLLKFKGRILSMPITMKTMGIIKNFREKKLKKEREEVIKHGIILLGFNFILVLAFVALIMALSFLLSLIEAPVILLGFMPLIVIFVIAGISAVVWYRVGQIMGTKIKKNKAMSAAAATFISILPLLLGLFFLAAVMDKVGGFKQELLALTYLSITLLSALGALFEFFLVSMGAFTVKK